MNPAEEARYREWKGWTDESFGCCTRSLAASFEDELALCGLRGVPGCRVLELGFGNGAFAAWASGRGMEYSGTEVNSVLVDRGRAHGYDVHLEDAAFAGRFSPDSFDVVVAFDVLEHLSPEALAGCLQQVRRCLRPGGLLLARVPSGDSPFSRAIQHGDLTHLTTLGSSAVEQLAGANGFEVLQLREPAYPLRGGGVLSAVRRATVRVVRAVSYPLIAAVFMGGGSPVLTPNMVFVLRKQ